MTGGASGEVSKEDGEPPARNSLIDQLTPQRLIHLEFP